jgi:hypothetical protein
MHVVGLAKDISSFIAASRSSTQRDRCARAISVSQSGAVMELPSAGIKAGLQGTCVTLPRL